MYVDINPYDRSVTIDGVKVKEKVHSFPDKLNHLSTISCEYDAATDTITDVHNVHRYVSHFIAREYYYEHLKEFVDWYYLEQEAQLLAEDTEGFGKIVANGVTLDAEVQGDTLYLNAGEGIEITAEKEEASQAKVVKVTEKYVDVDQAENLNQISDKLRVGGLAVITNEEGTTFYKKEDDVTFKELSVKGTGEDNTVLPEDFQISYEKMQDTVAKLEQTSKTHTEQLEELENLPTLEVGSTVYSLLPIDSVTHHLLDGSLISGTGIYANFYEHVSEIFNTNTYSSLFTDEEAWQESVTEYGVCGKFVLNQVNKTVRLPKVTGFVEGTLDRATLGDLVEAGLPNITGSFMPRSIYDPNTEDGYFGALDTEGAFDFLGTITASHSSVVKTTAVPTGYPISFDASWSSSIYGNSDTVQPQSIKGYIYMIVATGISDTVEIDFKGVEKALFDLEEKVDNKANVALDNISKEALEVISYAATPSSSSIELSFPASGGTYTALADGYVYVRGTSTTLPAYLELVSGNLNVLSWSGNAGSATAVYIPVSKGQTIILRYTNHTLTVYRFVYANGSVPSDDSGTDSGTDSGSSSGGGEGGVSEVPD